MGQQTDSIGVEFVGEAAQRVKALQKETGQDVGTLVSGAVSVFSSVRELADKDGTVTIVSRGNYYKIKLPGVG